MRGLFLLLIGTALVAATKQSSCASSSCCFALCDELGDLVTEEQQDAYVAASLFYDGVFASPRGGGLVGPSGLTVDHCLLDNVTGFSIPGTCATFTASSKESLHVALLAHVFARTKGIAWKSIDGAQNEDHAIELASEILDRKLASYEKFLATAPGLGGFIPWTGVLDDGMNPINYTRLNTTIPALDNGQLAWGLYAISGVLGDQSYLGRRARAYFDVMVETMQTIFYDAKVGSFHDVVRVLDPTKPLSRANLDYTGMGYLNDPYEGELFRFMADLFGRWDSEAERDRHWVNARVNMVPLNYTHDGLPEPITVLRGWRFSAHEQWKYLMMPYRDVDIARRFADNAERARTWNSLLKGIPGLMASCYPDIHDYVDTLGIPEISDGFHLYSSITTTPYGAFPVILADRSCGLRWHRAMLRQTQMQGPMGSSEARNDGDSTTTLLMSWDTKITSSVAMLGGIGDFVRPLLDRENKLARFYAVVEREHKMAFETHNLPVYLSGEDLPFALPDETGHPSQVFSCCKLSSSSVRRDAVARPVVTPGYGLFDGGVNVTVTCATPGATIVYTLDGTEPSRFHGTSLEGNLLSLSGSGTIQLRVIAWRADLDDSQETVSVFTLAGKTTVLE